MDAIAAESWAAGLQEILDACVPGVDVEEQDVEAEDPFIPPVRPMEVQLPSMTVPGSRGLFHPPASSRLDQSITSFPSTIPVGGFRRAGPGSARSSNSVRPAPPQGLGLGLSSGSNIPTPIEVSTAPAIDSLPMESIEHERPEFEGESAAKSSRVGDADLPVLVTELLDQRHPLVQLGQSIKDFDRAGEEHVPVRDHGTLRGTVSMFDLRGQDDVFRALARGPDVARHTRELLSRSKVPERLAVQRDLDLLQNVSLQESDSLAYLSAAKAAGRKELPWTRMSAVDKEAFEKAGEKHWAQWIDNEAVEEVSGSDIASLWKKLKAEDKEDCVMKLRWVLTDKAASLRTVASPLPVESSAKP